MLSSHIAPPLGGRLNALFLLCSGAYDVVYRPDAAARIADRVNVLAPPMTAAAVAQRPEILQDVDLIFSGWGMPRCDADFLDAAPRLRAIFYAAGAVGGWATPQLWQRGITVTTANDANAIPVADYTVATILFSLKFGWRLSRPESRGQGFRIRPEIPGNYDATVGLVGMGAIARLIVERLRPFGVTCVTHDPFLLPEQASQLGVKMLKLAELFAVSDVVSLHAADLPSTRGMIGEKLLRTLKPGATLINTSRGRVVNEEQLVDVLKRRPDLQAVLDVTEVEPLPAASPLHELENVVLTPHIAGSQGRECQRMGDYMVDELDRYLAGRPLRWQVRPTLVAHSVHQTGLAEVAAGGQPVAV